MGLVTLATARQHLKPPGTVDDARITRLIEEASMIVLEYIKQPYDAFQADDGGPIDESLPGPVRAACLMVLGALYDNADGQNPDKNPISPAVQSLLKFYRVPTIA